MADRRHADQFITRRLWEEVCGAVLENWEELDAGAQDLARNRVIVRWRSLRERFKRELNKEMQAPSGSRGRRSRYKYARALSFLWSTAEQKHCLQHSGACIRVAPLWSDLTGIRHRGPSRKTRPLCICTFPFV
ncbi:uncharacterized protein LOC143809456 [Ranitomeya variabilis]|uniref:uncharacterized protein LOC143809456 n=1 Tax=Ranitomeya variabilis TaxID=490064 RepID=UPI0040576649